MKRPIYRDAIEWIVRNDDCHWLTNPHGSQSVTAALVADMFDVRDDKVKADLIRKHLQVWGK
jgi:hypothetical protein